MRSAERPGQHVAAKPARRPGRWVGLAAAALGWFASSASGASGAEVWTVASGEVRVRCALTVGGSFDAVTPAISGTLAWGPEPAGRPGGGAIRVRLDSLDTGIALRNAHLRENYLEIHRGEAFEDAVLTAVTLDRAPAASEGEFDAAFSGSLRLHGVELPIAGTARLGRNGDRIRVEARFDLSLEAFGIPPPRYLGVGVRDEVRISVSLEAIVAPSPPRAPM